MINLADDMQSASLAFQESIEEMILDGVPYYDDRIYTAARIAVRNYVPVIANLKDNRVAVGAEYGAALNGSEVMALGSLAVNAEFSGIYARERRTIVCVGNQEVEIVQLDLNAELVPRFAEPDPVDMVFYNEIVIPFGAIRSFDAQI